MKILSPAEMRDLDKTAIERLGMPESVLMENAASAALLVLEKQFQLSNNPGIILCGTGNNGGDGLALARKVHSLKQPVEVLLFGAPEKLSAVSLTNLKILQNLKIPLEIEPDSDCWQKALARAGYIVDALLGTGLNRPVKGRLLEIIKGINSSNKPVLSLDIPSGIYGDSGEIAGEAVRADACVTFGNPKKGNILYPGFSRQGKLYCSHISFPPEYYESSRYKSEINLPPALPDRDPEGYKNSFGKILLIGGGGSYFGAPALAAAALFRSGAGYVTAALPKTLAASFSTLCPEAVLNPLETTDKNSIHPGSEEELLELAFRHDGVILGPGITRNEETAGLIRRLVREIPVPLLIDADGLSAVAGQAELTRSRKAPVILTPHRGEQRTLLKGFSDNQTIENLYGAITVYKGPHSSIRTPEGREYINLTGNSGMGTAGSGDVLTGIIMGLIKSLSPIDAVRCAVLLHGLSADLAAEKLGEDSLIASDLVEYLPAALQFYRKNYFSLCENCYNGIHRLP